MEHGAGVRFCAHRLVHLKRGRRENQSKQFGAVAGVADGSRARDVSIEGLDLGGGSGAPDEVGQKFVRRHVLSDCRADGCD